MLSFLRIVLVLAFATLATLKLFGASPAEPSRLDALRPYVALLEGMLAIGFLFGSMIPTALLALLFSLGAIALSIAMPNETCDCFGGLLPESARVRIAVASALGALASFALAVELRRLRGSR